MVKKHKFMQFVQRFYGPVNPMESCRARSIYLTAQAKSTMRLTNIVHILTPEIKEAQSIKCNKKEI